MARIMRSRVTFLLAGILVAVAAVAENIKPEEIVARHLNSIGSPDSRAAIKSRVVQGTLKMHILVGGGGDVTGTLCRVSEQRQSNFVMRFATGGDWRGEQFIFDGERTGFVSATTSHTRSVFAQFVSSQDFIVKEGLLGGELSTAWALQNLDQNHAKLQSIGTKKVDGRELVGLQYFSKKGSEMQVRMYFDPETFQHVMTIYTLEFSQGVAAAVTDIRQYQNRYSVEERFSDFKAVDGLTLPTKYELRYTEDTAADNKGSQIGGTRFYDWNMTAEQIQQNVALDAKNFRVK